MSASQMRVRARATEDRLPLVASRQDRAAVHGQAGVRLAWWRRLCPSSLFLAGLTVLVLWVAVARLLRQGRLGSCALGRPGRARRSPGAVVAAGMCERIRPAERRAVLARGHVQDACFLALHAVVVIPLMTSFSVGAAALIGGHARWIELRTFGDAGPAGCRCSLTVVAMDGVDWLADDALITGSVPWGVFTAFHHSEEELSVLTLHFRADRADGTTGFGYGDCPGRSSDARCVRQPGRPSWSTSASASSNNANLRRTFGPVGSVSASPAYTG